MAHEHNPHQREMSDESMVRNLAAQIEAIWPQEKPIYLTRRLPPKPRILDVGRATGTDQHVGRHLFTTMTDAGLSAIAVQCVVVDTLRVPRETLARIWEAWRDGYTAVISEGNGMSREDVLQWWKELIACVRDPRGYAVWQLPVWTATR